MRKQSPSSIFRRSRLLSAAVLVGLLLVVSTWSYRGAEAREIEATEEWQLLGANDTIPAGLHVRMDLASGQRWAKLLDSDSNDKSAVELSASGSAEATDEEHSVAANCHAATRSALEEAMQKAAASISSLHDDTPSDPNVGEYDYMLMHRTLSTLPVEELERMGGLPSLPLRDDDAADFQTRMKQIWQQRQQELNAWQQEFIADMPKILRHSIDSIARYLSSPHDHIVSIMAQSPQHDEETKNIISVLHELEYHLSDIDMARDFHTMGGWPLLLSLVSDSVHDASRVVANNVTAVHSVIEQDEKWREAVWRIQAAASWAIGSAVKNTPEFHSWALEDLSNASGWQQNEPVTAVSLLVSSLTENGSNERFSKKRQKELYALGSLLRGNRLALRHFHRECDGVTVLANAMSRTLPLVDDENAKMMRRREMTLENVVFASRIQSLGSDLIMDIVLDSNERTTDKDIVEALTSESWCNSAIQLLVQQQQQQLPPSKTMLSIQAQALHAIETILPFCTFSVEHVETVEETKNSWKRVDIDKEYYKELEELTDRVLLGMQRGGDVSSS